MLYFSSLLALVFLSGAVTPYRLLGNFSVTSPAFIQIFQVNDATGPDLFITSFRGVGSGAVYTVPDIGSKLDNIRGIKPATAAGSLNWPNNIFLAPPGIFSETTLVWGDGFLVPGKSDGNVYAMHYKDGQFTKPFALAKTKSGYFFHQVEFHDMNGDGLLDIVTARVNKPLVGTGKGNFLWLECPQNASARDTVWTEHVLITGGPDVDFHLAELDNDPSTIDVVAPVYFSSTLNVYQFNKADLSVKAQAVIDNTIGAPYSVAVDDFNRDKNRQLLVSNHEGTQATTGLFLFDIPSDLIKGKWTKHQIGSNFPISASGLNQAAPGFSYSTTQKIGSEEYPTILVAGDGAQRAYQFTRTGDYQYTQDEIIKTNGVVGSVGIGDINGDGWNEFFVPNYDRDLVFVYTFAPATY